MIIYHKTLQPYARKLRKTMTEAENRLWYYLRRKQVYNLSCYRQKILGAYIVDFYLPAVKLVIECDGSQHLEPQAKSYDEERTQFLEGLGLQVLRFNNLEILKDTTSVLEKIWSVVQEKIPPSPPFAKGGIRATLEK